MSPLTPRPTGPFASFPAPDALPPTAEDRDLDALERLFDHLRDEARALRADARVLGNRIERLGHLSAARRFR
jgi:hypothetical protein